MLKRTASLLLILCLIFSFTTSIFANAPTTAATAVCKYEYHGIPNWKMSAGWPITNDEFIGTYSSGVVSGSYCYKCGGTLLSMRDHWKKVVEEKWWGACPTCDYIGITDHTHTSYFDIYYYWCTRCGAEY